MSKHQQHLQWHVVNAKEISELTNALKEAIKKLENVVNEFDNDLKGVLKRATFSRDEIFVAMNEVRRIADILETKVDASLWPIPTYVDLMFGI